MSNLILWSQNNPAWKGLLLGYNTERGWEIGPQGCLLTSFAMLIATVMQEDSWTPARLNDFLKSVQGFEPGGGLLRWNVIPQQFPFIQFEYIASNTAAYQALQDENLYGIAKLNGGAHYAFVPYQNTLADPWDGKLKPFSAYKINEIRIYRFVGGKGSGTAVSQAPATNPEDTPMTTEQKKLAYRIVLGREAENDTPVTAWDFISGAQPELSEQRAKAADYVAALGINITNLIQEKAQMQSTIEELNRQAKTDTMVIPPTPTASKAIDFRATEIEEHRPRVAARDGVSVDPVNENPPVPFKAGTVFHQASTVEIDGKVWIRTEKAVKAGSWYLTPEDVFDDAPASRVGPTSQVHVLLSMLDGIFKKLKNKFSKQ